MQRVAFYMVSIKLSFVIIELRLLMKWNHKMYFLIHFKILFCDFL
jgi:hypothetical protein